MNSIDRRSSGAPARLQELRPLAREASDLQRALDALNGAPAALAADGRRSRGQSGRPAASGSAAGDIRVRLMDT